MGRHAIVEKLHEQLGGKPKLTEPLILYLLVGVRKLLELENSNHKYPSLKFQCDWCLHTRLDKRGAIDVIKLFDELEDMRRPDGGVSKEQGEKLMQALGVDSFHRDLSTFLRDNGLPDDIVNDFQRWTEFLEGYGALIQDVPLEFRLTRIRHISKVVVKKTLVEKGRHYAVGPFLFALEWQPTRFDGKPVEPYRMNFNTPLPPLPRTLAED
jgi:hypothetical protein